MGKILNYVNNKDKIDKEIAEETKRLYIEGLSYRQALKKAREMYLGKEKEK